MAQIKISYEPIIIEGCIYIQQSYGNVYMGAHIDDEDRYQFIWRRIRTDICVDVEVGHITIHHRVLNRGDVEMVYITGSM